MPTINIRRALPRLTACVSSIVVAALGAWLLLVAPAQAAALTVRADCTGQAPGTCFTTLALAIAAANGNADADVITLGAATFSLTNVEVHSDLTIEGASTATTIIDGADGSGSDQMLDIWPAATVTIRNLTIQGGRDAFNAGILSRGNLTLDGVRMHDNQATGGDGGAILHAPGAGNLTITDSRFTQNTATGNGGAIWIDSSGIITISDTTFDANTANSGGAIYVSSGSIAVTRSEFVGVSEHIRANSGTVSYSSFPTRTATAINASGGGVTAENNWWGDSSGPNGLQQLSPGVTAYTPWLSSVVFDPTSLSRTVGNSAAFTITLGRLNSLGDTSTLPTGSGLRTRLVRAVANADSTGALYTESGGTYSYSFVGAAAGTTHVNALVEFGDSSSLPQPGDANVLSAVATVTWTAATPTPTPTPTATATPTPTPEEPDPTPTPTPTPAPNPSQEMSAQDKFEALVDAGIFQGLGGGGPELDEVMDRAQFAKVASLILGLEVGTGSQMTSPTFTDLPGDSWYSGYIDAAKNAAMFGSSGSGDFAPDPDLALLAVTLQNFLRAVGIDQEPSTGAAEGWAEGFISSALSTGLLADFSGSFSNAARDALVGSAWGAGGALSLTNEGQAASSEVNEPSIVVYEIAAADLPAATRAEEIVFARLEEVGQRWVSVDAEVTMNKDGSFGLVAIVRESGLYAIGVRPVAERAVHEGVTALAWLGPEGQAPERALRRASASVEALFAQDVGGRWVSYRPGNPAFAQTLTALRDGQPLFIISSKAGTWLLPVN